MLELLFLLRPRVDFGGCWFLGSVALQWLRGLGQLGYLSRRCVLVSCVHLVGEVIPLSGRQFGPSRDPYEHIRLNKKENFHFTPPTYQLCPLDSLNKILTHFTPPNYNLPLITFLFFISSCMS
jgi:hypothetical protein